MSRKCKCAITGEIGTADTFVRINGRYYKSQQVYDADQKRKEQRRELIDYICREFLGYGNGQPFPTSLPIKLKELSFYDDSVILETFKQCSSDIDYQFEHKQFASEYNKISYMFAIVKGRIAEINAELIRKQKQESFHKPISIECNDISSVGTRIQGKDISGFLDDDEL